MPSVLEPAPSHGSRAINLAAFDTRHCAKSKNLYSSNGGRLRTRSDERIVQTPALLYGVVPCGHRTLVSPSSLFPAQVSAAACVTGYHRIYKKEVPRHCSRRARRASSSNRRAIDKTGVPLGRRRRIFEAAICGHPWRLRRVSLSQTPSPRGRPGRQGDSRLTCRSRRRVETAAFARNHVARVWSLALVEYRLRR